MPVPRHRDIRIGTSVSIVLKADQRTGRQVQGTVAQLLTRGDHPHGVKVRLADGRIGRVQQLASVPTQTSITVPPRHQYNMNPEQNPWATSQSQGNPYVSQQDQERYQSQPQTQPQYGQQGQQGHAAQYYSQGYGQGQPQSNQTPPQAPQPHRSDTDDLLAQQNDRAEQLEHMQNYEATARQSDDDKNQAQLQKEFPGVDSSLIAALYGDTKDLSSTREMLQELART